MHLSRRAALAGLGAVGLSLAAAPAFAQDEARSGWAGVSLTVTDGAAHIADLDPLGPAARAGLRAGDLVLGWSGGALSALPAALSGPPGERLDLTVARGDRRRTVRLVLEAMEIARP
ncbi:PDZ domain-containing protein [Caulobacter sp. SLTY]|uniref:PDZ domain-containing protein n=1 Tax=Caulobacter sp. SLTY TaxID=2683262 RepID=UPI0014132C54|nr:PDZ domain-containing protein [Caulobacter sp. SLTY]NBB15238.1 PDZ domain-containing protein [Caulobacter sp. SLTY]